MGIGLHVALWGLLAVVPSVVTTPMPTASPAHQVFVLNEGNEPIFGLRIGEPATGKNTEVWSDDLLSFDRVIDVSEAQEVDMALNPSTCRYDIEATYRDGHIAIQRNIDLCRSQRILFTH